MTKKNYLNGQKALSHKIRLSALEPRIMYDAALLETAEQTLLDNNSEHTNISTDSQPTLNTENSLISNNADFQILLLPAAINDFTDSAILLSNKDTQTIRGTNIDANIGDAPHFHGTNNVVWYKYIAQESGKLTFDYTNTSFETRTYFYETDGSIPTNDNRVTSFNGSSFGDSQDGYNLVVEQGKTYYFGIDGKKDETGSFTYKLKFQNVENDEIENANIIDLTKTTIKGSNIHAVLSDNLHTNGTENTVWYKYVAQEDGLFSLNYTQSTLSNFDPRTFIYETDGESPIRADYLSQYSASDDNFDIKTFSGKTYYFGVDGKSNETGNFAFTVKLQNQINDKIENAILFDNNAKSIKGSNIAAIIDDNLHHNGEENTVWYKYIAQEDGLLSLAYTQNTLNKFDPRTFIYQTDGTLPLSYQHLQQYSASDNNYNIEVFQGKTYYVGIDGKNNETENFTFTVKFNNQIHDRFENAIDLGNIINGRITGSNVAAIFADGPNSHGKDNGVWYKWTAQETGLVELNHIAKNADPRTYVYLSPQGNYDVSSLQSLNVNASSPNISFSVEKGNDYYFLIDQKNDQTGTFSFDLIQNIVSNDAFAKAQDIGSAQNIVITGDTKGAINNIDTNNFGYHGQNNALWYKYVPSTSGELTLRNDKSFTNQRLFIYEGVGLGDTANNVEELIKNNEDKIIKIQVEANKVYYIAVDGKSDNVGAFAMRVILDKTPDNQTVSNALNIGNGEKLTIYDNNRNISPSPQQNIGDGLQHTKWYKFEAQKDSIFDISVKSSNFNSLLQIFSGTAENLIKIGEDSAIDTDNMSQIQLPVEASKTYYVAIDGIGDQTGTFSLTYTLTAKDNGNNFNSAQNLGTANKITLRDNNLFTDHEDQEFLLGEELAGSKWYNWQALETGFYSLTTTSSRVDTYLGVFLNPTNNINDIIKVAQNDGLTRTSIIHFYAEKGQDFAFAVDGKSQGNFNLSLRNITSGPSIPTEHTITLPNISEDSLPESHTVESLFKAIHTDPNGHIFGGIAITSNLENIEDGHWEYSFDGENWEVFNNVNISNAVILEARDYIRFVPEINYSGPVSTTLEVHLWDQSTKKISGSHIDLSNEIARKISAQSITLEIKDIEAVADIPELIAIDISSKNETNIPLSISADTIDPDSETLAIYISNIPKEIGLSNGKNLGSGLWQLTKADLTNLYMQVPKNFETRNLVLTIKAEAKESSNGQMAEISKNIFVNINNRLIINSEITLDTPPQGEATLPFFDNDIIPNFGFDISNFIRNIQPTFLDRLNIINISDRPLFANVQDNILADVNSDSQIQTLINNATRSNNIFTNIFQYNFNSGLFSDNSDQDSGFLENASDKDEENLKKNIKTENTDFIENIDPPKDKSNSENNLETKEDSPKILKQLDQESHKFENQRKKLLQLFS